MGESTERHNKLAGEILRSIVKPIIDAGGTRAEILVLTESVVAGVVEFCARNDGVSRDIVFDAIVDGVRNRLDEIMRRQA